MDSHIGDGCTETGCRCEWNPDIQRFFDFDCDRYLFEVRSKQYIAEDEIAVLKRQLANAESRRDFYMRVGEFIKAQKSELEKNHG